MEIFISHITEEGVLASCLKKWIENLFLGHYEVFVSSDGESIRLGRKWIDEIDESLNDCKIIIALCSPVSITRPWINFEVGCGYIKRIPVITICHSGLEFESLPAPLNLLQGVDLADDSVIDKLLNNLANDLGVRKAPPVHPDMLRELREAEASIQTRSSEPGLLTYYQGLVQDDPMDDKDILNVLDDWFVKISAKDRVSLISFRNVDETLNFPSGTAKKFLKSIASRRNYSVQIEGVNTITFKNDSARKRMSAFM